ncbi:MAG: LPS export ABC transporter permease LptF [Methylotenera sp.]|nr:LPS export ABC transporter permease LptF [Methylotenera sp.]
MLFKRSLIQELISTASGALLVLVGVVIAQRAGYLIQLAAKGVLPNDAISTVLGFNLLRFLPMLLSLSLFLAVLLTLTRWYRDSEMVIWFSSGLSIKQWVRPILEFSLPIVFTIALLSLFLTPWAINKVEQYRTQLKSRDELSAISPGVFKESAHTDRVFFAESFDDLGKVVKNVFVQSRQDENLSIIVATKGHRIIEKNGDNYLIMENGRRYHGKPDSAEFSTTEFEQYAIRVEAELLQSAEPTAPSLSSLALIKTNKPKHMAELQWRLAMPISALILALLAIPLSAIDARAGRSANIALALIIFILYNNMLSILQAWISQGKISTAVGLWPVHALFLCMAIYMLYRRNQQLSLFPRLKFS